MYLDDSSSYHGMKFVSDDPPLLHHESRRKRESELSFAPSQTIRGGSSKRPRPQPVKVTLETLPADTLTVIFQFLPTFELCQLSHVSKEINAAVDTPNALWLFDLVGTDQKGGFKGILDGVKERDLAIYRLAKYTGHRHEQGLYM